MKEGLRFSLVPTLGLCAPGEDARRILEDGLGFTPVDETPATQGFHGGKLSVFVDTSELASEVRGFLPLLAVNDLEGAKEHLAFLGCDIESMPWAPDADGVLVSAPGEVRFCLVSEDSVVALRHGGDDGDS